MVNISEQPVRKIGRSYRSFTGYASLFQSDIQFESALEHDFLIRLAIHPGLLRVVSQPVQIEFRSEKGRKTVYTPDFLVEYASKDGEPRRVLYEIKYRRDLWANWPRFKVAYRAAIAFARENGMEFRIATDRRIRTQAMGQAIALKRYLSICADQDLLARIRAAASSNNPIEIFELARSAKEDSDPEAAAAHVLHLISQGVLEIDPEAAITPSTPVKLASKEVWEWPSI